MFDNSIENFQGLIVFIKGLITMKISFKVQFGL